MKQAILFVCSLLILECLSSDVDAVHSVGVPGKCPDVETVEDFDPKRMKGKWHSIFETGKEASCVCYEFEEAAPNRFHGYLFHKNASVSLEPKNPKNYGDGFVVTSKLYPALDQAVMKVFATDYDSYAGMYTCKEFKDIHFPHFAFWSRDTSLNDQIVLEMKNFLSKYDFFDVKQMKSVDHSDCS